MSNLIGGSIMNKLDMFFKEEIDYEDYVNTVEEDASLDFLVEKEHCISNALFNGGATRNRTGE